MLNFGITTSLVDNDALTLVHDTVSDVEAGIISDCKVNCVVSTRGMGDNSETDNRLRTLEEFLSPRSIPLVMVSAKQAGRLVKSPTNKDKDRYDGKIIEAVEETCGPLPSTFLMAGDMITHGLLCDRASLLNLHPDIPHLLGGVKGIYYQIIGNWVREEMGLPVIIEGKVVEDKPSRNRLVGSQIHLGIRELDMGDPVAYFAFGLRDRVADTDLNKLWDELPKDSVQIGQIIREQVAKKDKPDHPLFRELRRAEAQYEMELIRQVLISITKGRINIIDGKVCNETRIPLPKGLDLSHEVLKDSVVNYVERQKNPRKET